LWISPLAKIQSLCVAIMGAMVVGVAYGLSQVLSGRAAYMHVGAMLGTWMVWNVWVRIIPAQKALVASTKTGTKPDPELGKKAKQRSRHNNYLTYPVVFIMLSNHFPSTYGSPLNWVILIVIFLVGVAARHFENTGDRSPAWVFGVLGVVALLADSSLTAMPVEEGTATSEQIGPAAPSTGGPSVPPPNAGSIEGTVHYAGAPPARKTLAIPGTCAPEGKSAVSVFANDVLVKDGRVQNAFVWIKEGMGDWKGAPPNEEVILDQHGCMYAPRVIGAEVGQRVTFVNSDPVLHNVRVISDKNPTFNLNMAAKGMRLSKTFTAPDVMLAAKCDVHPWMSGFIGVVPHPYYAVSGGAGEFALTGVPPGEYVVEAWHEVYGRKTQKVVVGTKTTARVDVSFP
jgi:plastocyanin